MVSLTGLVFRRLGIKQGSNFIRLEDLHKLFWQLWSGNHRGGVLVQIILPAKETEISAECGQFACNGRLLKTPVVKMIHKPAHCVPVQQRQLLGLIKNVGAQELTQEFTELL